MLQALSDLFLDIVAANLLNLAAAKWTLLIFLIFYAFGHQFRQQLRIIRLMFRLPGAPGHPILGHLIWITDPERFKEVNRTFRKYGPVVKIWNSIFPVVAIFDPNDIEKVLRSSKHLQKPFVYSFLKNMLGDGLVTSEVSIWKNHRRMLQPYFHVKYIEEHIPIFNKGSQILMETFTEQIQEGSSYVNFTSFINKCILCILGETILGLDFDPKTAFRDVDSLPFRDNANIKLLDRILKPWLGFNFIYKGTSQAAKEVDIANSRTAFTKVLINKRREMRQKALLKNKCFLDFLLDLSEDGSFSEEDCMKEICTFMLAGQDTVAATMAFCLHQIANNGAVQEKIITELEIIFGDSQRPPTASDVRHMIYLEQCIKETMRLYPVVPLVFRTLGEDTELGNHVIPKGCSVLILPGATHLQDECYPDPEKFNPDNFEPKKCEQRHQYAFLPFSAGPRNCIGNKFAIIEMKTIISNILRKFSLTPAPGKEKLTVKFRVTLRASGGVWVGMTPRISNSKKI